MEKKSVKAAEGKHVVVSGGSRGLGLGICQELLKEGYTISSFSRKRTEAMSILEKEFAGRFFFWECDIADSAALKKFVQEACGKLGGVYGVINNSAIAVDGVLATLPEIEISRMLQINLEGSIFLARHCIRKMLGGKDGGRIINISSIVGSRGFTGLTVYSATKAGLDGFTRGLAREVGRRGITVNSIAPGYMETDMSSKLDETRLKQIINRTPMDRLARIDDVVPLIQFLLSEGSRFITGQTIVVDGGGIT